MISTLGTPVAKTSLRYSYGKQSTTGYCVKCSLSLLPYRNRLLGTKVLGLVMTKRPLGFAPLVCSITSYYPILMCDGSLDIFQKVHFLE